MRLSAKQYKWIKIAASVLAILLLAGGTGLYIVYSKRNAILTKLVVKAREKARQSYDIDLKLSNPHFEGLRTVAFTDVSAVPYGKDSLMHITNMKVSVKLLPLLVGDIKVAEFKASSGKISLIKRDSVSNYDFLFKKKESTRKQKQKTNYAQLAYNLLNQLLYKIPDNMDFRNFEILVQQDGEQLRFFTPVASIDNGEVETKILVNGNEATWHLKGEVDGSSNKLDMYLYADNKKVEMPILEKKYKLKLNFDTVFVKLKDTRKRGDEFRVYGFWKVRNLLINHPKIAANDIIVPDGSIDADLLIGQNYLSVDSSSVIHLKDVEARPFIKYTAFPHKKYELKLNTDEMDAATLFDAFPKGLFESLEGTEVAGKLQYSLSFALDSQRPDDVVFKSSLRSNKFRVIRWGKTDLRKINEPFIYTPYEYGKPMRDIIIGPQNPDFTPLEQIAPDLRNAVLTAEDPSFFRHKGFVEKAITNSIATNFKEKAFKRGGSTISMQLVKNVFLNRQKNLARKIEEIFIVWIMETTRTSTKARMFEVYLNLIEWGNNVYGIGEASRYYFAKQPSQLSLGESIFLANIIPRPKKGLYFFQPDGSVSARMRGYFKIIGNMMAQRGYTTVDSNAYGFYGVRLREGLRRGVPDTDSLSTDSLFEEDAGMDENFLRDILHDTRHDTLHTPRRQPAAEATQVQDTVLSRSEKRRLRREQRRLEREQKKQQE